MEDMTFTTEVTIKFEDFEHMLISALEGGSNYWYWLPEKGDNNAEGMADVLKWAEDKECEGDKEFEGLAPSELIARYVWEGGCVRVTEGDAQDEHILLWALNRTNVKRGFKVMQEEYPRHWDDLQRDNADAETADVWFQCALMGEVTFG